MKKQTMKMVAQGQSYSGKWIDLNRGFGRTYLNRFNCAKTLFAPLGWQGARIIKRTVIEETTSAVAFYKDVG